MNSKILIMFLSCACVFLSGCASTKSDFNYGLVDLKEPTLQDVCQRNGIDWELDPSTQVVKLSHRDFDAQAMVGSQVLIVDEQSINLSEPLKRKANMIVVSSDFEEKLLGKKIKSYERPKPSRKVSKVKKIIIDAGHGGKDSGALGHSHAKEKDVVLKMARQLKKKFERHGIDVVMTRSSDHFVTLADRTVQASRSDADLFISIHANAHKNASARGFEVFYLKNLSSSDLNESQRRQNQARYLKTKKSKSDKHVHGIVNDMMYSHKQSESYLLANKISNYTTSKMRLNNRGAKSARFFVLRNSLIPAVLVEMGFLSNPKEERLLTNSRFQDKMADAVVKSVLDYAYDS